MRNTLLQVASALMVLLFAMDVQAEPALSALGKDYVFPNMTWPT